MRRSPNQYPEAPHRRLLKLCQRIKMDFPEYMEKMGRQVVTFGVVMAINFPLFLLVWGYRGTKDNESLVLRIIATLLCLGLAGKSAWPVALKKWLPIYWYMTLCFTLPFFFIYLALVNGGDTLWLMNLMSSVFFLYLLTDVISALLLLIVGALLAYGVFCFFHSAFVYHSEPVTFLGVFITLASAILIASLFSRNRDLITKQKLSVMSMVAGSIAHELRTPLASIKFAMEGLLRHLPSLLRVYDSYYQQNPTEKPPIRSSHFETIKKIPASISREISRSNLIIDGILKNIKVNGIRRENFIKFSVNKIILQVMSDYPFDCDEDKAKIAYHCSQDFMVDGDPELFIHVLFNLIKNAFYFIDSSGKGEISIQLIQQPHKNCLIFKDTARGIEKKSIPHLFDRFYSQRKNGTGIGLAFCKLVVEAFQGKIACDSILGEHTTFYLTFPKKPDQQ